MTEISCPNNTGWVPDNAAVMMLYIHNLFAADMLLLVLLFCTSFHVNLGVLPPNNAELDESSCRHTRWAILKIRDFSKPQSNDNRVK